MVTLRQFQPGDLQALYETSLATGYQGTDASHLYRDKTLIGKIYSAPYALLEPSLARVAMDGDGVAGFAVGTLDTVLWENALELNWWPSSGANMTTLVMPCPRCTPQTRGARS
jgi:hypothetical protein